MDVIASLPSFPVSIAMAFLLGFLARTVGLPPMVGFLCAGFALSGLGVSQDPAIGYIADFGVTLLLFVIGLKLKVKTLARPEIWAGASLHASISVVVLAAGLMLLAAARFSVFAALDPRAALLIAFALSFSSTVFAVKVLEDKGEMESLHGRTAIGILIIQDLFAVVFLTASTGALPSIWALGLIGLLFLRPALGYLLNRVGHGELLPLFGLFAAVVMGAALFEQVGMKADLGALLLGMLMANHPRASDIASALFGFKEVLLVGFFLQIGLAGVPTLEQVATGILLVLLLPLKTLLFGVLLGRFHLRARSFLLASLSLATYSEFGLIVGTVGASNGWIDSSWLTVIAISLSVSFLLASPFNASAHGLYAKLQGALGRLESKTRHPEDRPLDIGTAEIAIFGMGRIGSGAYEVLRDRYGAVVVGIESNPDKVAEHRGVERRVIHGDATDSDFWERIRATPNALRVVLLAMPEHKANLYALEQIKAGGFSGFIAALAKFPDQAESLEAAGADLAFNMYGEAGAGFALNVHEQIETLSHEDASRGAEADA